MINLKHKALFPTLATSCKNQEVNRQPIHHRYLLTRLPSQAHQAVTRTLALIQIVGNLTKICQAIS